MRQIKFALAFAAALSPLAAFGESAPANLPAQSVYGRMGIPGDTGPGQAIPFANLAAQLFGGPRTANTVFAGPASGPVASPAFRALVGADLPAPSSSTLGGTQSVAVVAHTYMTGISTAGVPTVAIPVCADLSNAATSCSTDTTNASNISSGTLGGPRLPAPFTSGTASGNTSKFVTTTGSLTNGHCASFDSNGNAIDSGANCGSSAMTLLNTLTASNSATLGDTTSLTSAFSVYEIVFENIIQATAATTCEIQVHASAAFQATGYINATLANAGTNSIITSIPTTFIQCSLASGANNSSPGINGSIRVFTPSAASIHMWTGQVAHPNSSTVANVITSGYWNTSGVIDGFQVLFSSGNITSGAIKIYGIQ